MGKTKVKCKTYKLLSIFVANMKLTKKKKTILLNIYQYVNEYLLCAIHIKILSESSWYRLGLCSGSDELKEEDCNSIVSTVFLISLD